MTEAGEKIGARDIYNFIEKWWGEPFDIDLLQRIAGAPDEHTNLFIKEWRDLHRRWKAQGGDLSLKQNLGFVPLIGHEVGQSSCSRHALGRAIALLLIQQCVAVDDRFLFPVQRLPIRYLASYRHRPFASALYDLLAIRPLVEDGSVKFAKIDDPDDSSNVFERMVLAAELGKGDKEVWTNFGLAPTPVPFNPQYPEILEIENTLFRISGTVASTLAVCKLTNTTPIATAPWAEFAYQKLIAGRHLDGRIARVDVLASVDVPHMAPERITELIAVRASSDAYQMLRTHVKDALRDVTQLPEGDDAIRVAGDILYEELNSSLARVQSSIRQSPVLSAMKHGLKSLTLRAISAGVGVAASGNDGVSARAIIAQAVADQGGDTVDDYLKRLRNRRTDKAILGLVTAFNALEDKAWADPYWDIDQRIDRERRPT